MRLTVPALDDGVVALRRPEPGDVETTYEVCQDPEIARFTTVPSPYEHEHAVQWFEHSVERWTSGESAPFVIVDSTSGELLGSISLVRLDREQDVAEVGYLVKRQARGRGVAPRAVNLVAGWARYELGFSRVELLIDVRNHASQRVAEKAGFVREREVDPPERCRERSDRMVLFALSAEVPAGR